ncbi:MAG: hypothetical protein LBR50_10590 [Tannerella sp.]|jgi:hypothetical protein|nr:hypothetical protein [Tannerella sp.]
MSRKVLAGIRRGNEFSPNHIGNDAAIFALTVKHLRSKGYTVNEYIETDLQTRMLDEDAVFSMARDIKSVRALKAIEDGGRMVVNSGYGVENCTREKMTRLLLANDIAHPRSIFVATDSDAETMLADEGFNDCWIKRGDFHAIHREDVTYARNPEEAKSIIREFAIRGIETAVVNEHLVGDLVKFYGVAGTGFFYWFYPTNCGGQHTKFGNEQINGVAREFPFDVAHLQQLCERSANILNVRIYGGDCIVAENGVVRLIDFNDWPSFAPCRDLAAPYIADCISDIID